MSTDDLIDLSRQAANEAAKAYEQGRADERTALAEHQTEGELTDEELWATLDKATADFPPIHPEAGAMSCVEYAQALELRKARAVEAAVIARRPAPAPPAEGEVAKLMKCLKTRASFLSEVGANLSQRGDAFYFTRAAELLQRQHPQPVPVSERLPGRVEQALIKAECALSDIAEGEAAESEGDPLEWAEKRAADALARIRPVMRQHQIQTSEWPLIPAHALPLPSGEVEA